MHHRLSFWLCTKDSLMGSLAAVYIQAMDQPFLFTINRMFIISFLSWLCSHRMQRKGEKMDRRLGSAIFFRPHWFYSTVGLASVKWSLEIWLISPIKKALSGDFTEFWETAANNPLYLINIGNLIVVWGQSQGHYKNIFRLCCNYMPLPLWWCLAAATMIFETGAIFSYSRGKEPVYP